MNTSQILFYIGIALMSCAGIGGIAAFVVLRAAGKRLKAQMEAEYGRKRR